ncbi:MAG: hypothetical protein ABR949_12395 [Candidatus Aquilonibacter sp.]|jgi:hypothetical protein
MSNARFVAALIFVGALAGCGGGGGGGTTLPQATPTPATNLGQQAVQRSDAQSALAGVQAYEEYSGGGSISTFSAARAMHLALTKVDAKGLLARTPRADATCEDGAEESIVAGAGGSEIVTIEDFYDDGCTEPEAEIVWTASQSGNNITGPATFTQYAQNGSVTGTASATITFYYTSTGTPTGYAFLLTNITQNGTNLGDVGFACTLSSTGATTACGVAAVANVASQSVEQGASVSMAVASGISMQIEAYQGAENTLSVAQSTLPNWSISPSSDLTASVSISGQATATGFTLTLTDNSNGGTFAITGSSSGSVTGTLTSNTGGATDATFTVNAQGNGTLTYSNGTQVSIVDYLVQG